MNSRYFLIFLCCMALLAACNKDEIQTFGEQRYAQFTTPVADTAEVSFFFHPGQDIIQYALPVELIGRVSSHDVPYHIRVVDSVTTATGNHYSLPGSFQFDAGQTADTVYLTIHKTPEMESQAFLLVLEIAPTEEVLPGEKHFTRRALRLSDMTSRPTWWDANMVNLYLGVYTDRKYQTFIEVTGVADLSQFDSNEQRDLMLQFKYYLIDRKDAGDPVLEEDGTDMLSTVRIIG